MKESNTGAGKFKLEVLNKSGMNSYSSSGDYTGWERFGEIWAKRRQIGLNQMGHIDQHRRVGLKDLLLYR